MVGVFLGNLNKFEFKILSWLLFNKKITNFSKYLGYES